MKKLFLALGFYLAQAILSNLAFSTETSSAAEVPLAKDSFAKIEGLVKASQYNGLTAHVIAFDQIKRRYKVEIRKGSKTKPLSIKKANLKALSTKEVFLQNNPLAEDGLEILFLGQLHPNGSSFEDKIASHYKDEKLFLEGHIPVSSFESQKRIFLELQRAKEQHPGLLVFSENFYFSPEIPEEEMNDYFKNFYKKTEASLMVITGKEGQRTFEEVAGKLKEFKSYFKDMEALPKNLAEFKELYVHNKKAAMFLSDFSYSITGYHIITQPHTAKYALQFLELFPEGHIHPDSMTQEQRAFFVASGACSYAYLAGILDETNLIASEDLSLNRDAGSNLKSFHKFERTLILEKLESLKAFLHEDKQKIYYGTRFLKEGSRSECVPSYTEYTLQNLKNIRLRNYEIPQIPGEAQDEYEARVLSYKGPDGLWSSFQEIDRQIDKKKKEADDIAVKRRDLSLVRRISEATNRRENVKFAFICYGAYHKVEEALYRMFALGDFPVPFKSFQKIDTSHLME